jgi:hypothetical protein
VNRPFLHPLFVWSSLLALVTGLAQGQTLTPASPPPRTQAYLYVEPFQGRFEVLIDLRTALDWLAIPDFTGPTLPASAATAITEKAAALAQTWLLVRTESTAADTRLALTQLVIGEPGRTLPYQSGDPIAVANTLLGFMWEFPLQDHPQNLTLFWKGFIENVPLLPLTAYFGRASEKAQLTENANAYTWNNHSRLDPPKPLASVPQLPEQQFWSLRLGSVLWISGGLLYFGITFLRRRRLPGGALPHIGVWILGTLLTTPLLVLRIPTGQIVTPRILQVDEGQSIVSPLLRNIYRAFDHRDESAIYDLLARSADGPLLKQLYLDIIAALSLDEAEAARVHVAEFAAEVESLTPASANGFTALTSWSALGSVGHWGHTHTRTNVNQAKITVHPVNGAWKITAIEMLEQRRL